MTVIIIDGPEGAGKSSIIGAMVRMVDKINVRPWGPVRDWTAYLGPLEQDLAEPGLLSVWDRSWAAELVYNELLARGRQVTDWDLCRNLEIPLVLGGGTMVMVVNHPAILAERRLRRIKEGGKADLPVDPATEVDRFRKYAAMHQWDVLESLGTPEQLAESLLASALRKAA